jgi:hypothetical protein
VEDQHPEQARRPTIPRRKRRVRSCAYRRMIDLSLATDQVARSRAPFRFMVPGRLDGLIGEVLDAADAGMESRSDLLNPLFRLGTIERRLQKPPGMRSMLNSNSCSEPSMHTP